jgi:hypothetical protein
METQLGHLDLYDPGVTLHPWARGDIRIQGVGPTLRVRPDGSHEGPHERAYERCDLRRLRNYLRGRTITVANLLEEIRIGFLQMPLREEGPRASYEVRDMLVILCALGLASVDTTSREHLYSIP